MDKEKDYFQEDGDLQEILVRFENMLNQLEAYFFDVHEFEKIIDHYLDTNHFTKAIDAVRYGINQHSGSTTLLIKEVQVYAEKGESAKALKMINSLEKIEESNNEVYMLKGMILNQLGKVNEAEVAFEKAVDLSYENLEEILYDIALSFEYINQYKIALGYLEKAYKRNSKKLNILYDLAYCYDRLHDFGRSIKYYEIYLDHEPFSENVWYNLGLLYFKKENFNKAVECYDFAIAINDQYSSAIFNKANAQANLEDYEEAVKTYKECILLEPENVLAHCYLGESLEKLENYHEAIQWYQKSTEIDPSYSEGWYGIAVCYLFLKLYNDALFYVSKAISKDEENPDFWFTLGNVHAHLGSQTDAIKAYSRTTELDPYDDEAWLNLAHLNFMQGNTGKAISVLKDSYSYTFDIPIINFHLAGYHYLIHKSDQALKFFEKGLKLDYAEYRSVRKISHDILEAPLYKICWKSISHLGNPESETSTKPYSMNQELPYIPERTPQPRESGLTMMMDKGLSIRESENFISSSAAYTDLVKFGFGTALISMGLEEKISLYKSEALKPYFGGTLFELFVVRNRFDDFRKMLDRYQLEFAEVSDGSMAIPHDEKLEYIQKLAEQVTVISEVGSKVAGAEIPDEKWVTMMKAELAAGSWKVIAEARESGTIGIYQKDGSANTGLIDEIVRQIAVEDVLWEAPNKNQQVWFIQLLGANVNLGNIAPGEVISLESLRLGLRGDTFFSFLPESFHDKKL